MTVHLDGKKNIRNLPGQAPDLTDEAGRITPFPCPENGIDISLKCVIMY